MGMRGASTAVRALVPSSVRLGSARQKSNRHTFTFTFMHTHSSMAGTARGRFRLEGRHAHGDGFARSSALMGTWPAPRRRVPRAIARPGRGACASCDIENYDIVCCQIPGTFNILRPMTKRASGQLVFMFIRGPSPGPLNPVWE